MGSFAPGAQIFDVTVPFGSNIPGWPGQPAAEVTPEVRAAKEAMAAADPRRFAVVGRAGTPRA